MLYNRFTAAVPVPAAELNHIPLSQQSINLYHHFSREAGLVSIFTPPRMTRLKINKNQNAN